MKYDFYYHNNVLTREECETINSNLNRDITAGWQDAPAAGVTKTAKTSIIQWNKAKEYLSTIEDLAHMTNENYFGFNINRYHNFSTVNYNEYSSEQTQEYGWHADGFKLEKQSDIKLTVIMNISTESYTGGELQLFLNNERTMYDMNDPGTVIVFPSWIQHRVTPVTSGTRKSVSFWLIGPKFI
jgi:PKHD-type hydroxylase